MGFIVRIWFWAIQTVKVRLWIRWDYQFFTGGGFLTWHRRPKSFPFYASNSQSTQGCNDIGIVVQGPVVWKHRFTFETLRHYRNTYPMSSIVLSTWATLPPRFLRDCESIGVHVIQNAKVNATPYGNLTRQQVTSLAGLRWLANRNIEFALKTRADQRLYSRDFLELLTSIVRFFPRVRDRSESVSRIVVTYQNSFNDRFLSASDFLQFGSTRDLVQMWESVESSTLPRELAAEQIIAGSYLLSLGWPRDNLFSLEHWRKAQSEVFGFVDSSSLDLFWLKYSSREFLWRRYGREPLAEVQQRDWLDAMFAEHTN